MFHKISLVSIVSWPRRGKFLTNIYCHKHLIDKKLHDYVGENSENCVDILKKEGILSWQPRRCVYLLIHVRL